MTISQTNSGQIRPAGGPIVRIGPARRTEAICRLVGDGGGSDAAAAQRFLNYARANAIRLDHLWARLDQSGAIDATVLVVPSPGRTAMFFSSRTARGEDVAPTAALIEHACEALPGASVHLGQALLEPAARLDRDSYLEAGFTELARLSYMERGLGRGKLPARPQWPAGVTVEPYTDELEPDLLAALEASYVRTRDCPGLYGLRDTADIVAGHRATGVFHPALWSLLRLDGRPAGAILLNVFPAHRTAELVYLGLAPEARGRGLGRQLLRHGLWLLAGRHERTLTLAVDEGNGPAIALYRTEGMRVVLHRVALIRSLRATDGAR